MLHQVQWNAFVELLPLWLAPNMVTLLGFLFIIANVGLVLAYIPDLVGPVGLAPLLLFPTWTDNGGCGHGEGDWQLRSVLLNEDTVMKKRLYLPLTGSIMGLLQFCHWSLDVSD